MSRFASPLRYPGGKSSTLLQVREIIKHNKLENGYYVEPYAGGCGLALSLLFEGTVKKIYINDLDRSIWAFWYSILRSPKKFIKKIEETEISIDEWYKQKEIQSNKSSEDPFLLGFSTFFLNRTNRSGIIKAGPIGGINQQGKYKIDCRFNKKGLIKRINKISKFKHKINLYNCDALAFMSRIDKKLHAEIGVLNIDPPYFSQGPALYTNSYKKEDHQELANVLLSYPHPWMLTYDNMDFIKKLYESKKCYNFDLNYAAGRAKRGTELLVLKEDLTIPDSMLEEGIITMI